MEATQVFSDGWMSKQNVVYTYKVILFSLKEGNSGICFNMNKLGYYTSEIRQSQ